MGSLKALIKTGTEGVNDPFTEPNKWSPDFHDFMQQVSFILPLCYRQKDSKPGQCLQFDAKERPTSLELLDHPFPKKRVTFSFPIFPFSFLLMLFCQVSQRNMSRVLSNAWLEEVITQLM